MIFGTVPTAFSILIAGIALTACRDDSNSPANSPPAAAGNRTEPEPAPKSDRIRYAILLKPNESERNGPAETFAPLIVQRTSGGHRPDKSGARSDELARRFSERPLPVYARVQSVTIAALEFQQVTYTWCHPGETGVKGDVPSGETGVNGAMPLSGGPSGSDECNEVRGVRITLGEDGFPIVWEALSSQIGDPVLYVSRSLEERAAREQSPPPARRFSIERPLEETPGVIVADVLADGPVPMGPYIYIGEPPSRELESVLCRCSPSQVDEFSGTHYYELRMADRSDIVPEAVRAMFDRRTPLAQLLRWPE